MTPPMPQAGDVMLPPLREDLQLVPGASAPDGSPTWVLVDRLRGKYFQIGWVAYQMLSRWHVRSAEEVVSAIHSETTCRATRKDIDDFLGFLYGNHLVRDPLRGGYRTYVAQAEAVKPQWLMWLVHHYLFFQIPLVRPDRFLRATLPFVERFFARSTAWIIALLGLTGAYLTSRQWDAFMATFPHFFTPHGFALCIVCLVVVKVFHELGHAYTATRYGCRITTMGIALILMVPMLYSDISDAWKLSSRRQRAAIGAAGMIVEGSLAALAICAWNFLDDGIARSLAFIIATTSLLLGVTINLNPFMRFDGYYVLSDLLGLPNLHDRAFAFEVKEGRHVKRGDMVVTLESPVLEKDVAVTRKRIEVESLKGRRETLNQQELGKHQVTLETLRARLSQLEGLMREQQNLSLTAPIAGVIADRAEALHVGRWINKELPLAYLVDTAGEELHALAPESDVDYLRAGQSARFIPEGVERPSLKAQVVEIRDMDESSFTVPYLASLYGGAVPVRGDADRKLRPETSVYRVTLRLTESSPRWNQAVRGTVLVEGPRISLAHRAWENGIRVLIRESGV